MSYYYLIKYISRYLINTMSTKNELYHTRVNKLRPKYTKHKIGKWTPQEHSLLISLILERGRGNWKEVYFYFLFF